MVPLYAARVQDLGPDDVAVFKCGACGHTAELWPSLLIGGLGLKPTDKVLDLERRLRVPTVPRKGAGCGVDQVEGDELNLPLAQESWAYSSSPAAASMGRKSSSKVRESEKYQLKSWWSPIWCRVGATTIRTGGSDHADAV